MKCMLTTVDNPFNPFTNWDEWYNYDEASGYCTSGLLARITRTSNELSAKEQEDATNEAIDQILELFPDGLYKKVTEDE